MYATTLTEQFEITLDRLQFQHSNPRSNYNNHLRQQIHSFADSYTHYLPHSCKGMCVTYHRDSKNSIVSFTVVSTLISKAEFG